MREDNGFDIATAPVLKTTVTVSVGPLPRFQDCKPVLIVDDNFANLELVQFQLREFGLAGLPAYNGQKAVELVTSHPADYSLILMDLRMPDLDGLIATKLIRKHESVQGGHSIIVALTANALPGDHEICLKAGMDDYMAKPMSLITLGRTLEKWLIKPQEKGEQAQQKAT